MSKSIQPLRVVLAGGGTGGHVFPALAIRQGLAQRDAEAQVLFVGTSKGLEARVIPQAGERLKTIWISGFSRSNMLQNVLLPLKLSVSLLQCLRLHLTFRPNVVIGTGGYVTGPLVWTAQLLRIPTVLQEQNSCPGWTTKKLAPRATAVCVGFEGAKRRIRSARIHVTGNPLRMSFRKMSREDARAKWPLDASRKTLLIFGGSLGARSINNTLVAALPTLLRKYNLIWQTGKTGIPAASDTALIEQATRTQQLIVRDFIDDMPGAYAMADLAVCRAGAMTLAELAVSGVPAILIPFPFATDDHQTVNARSVVEAGAARLIPDRDLSPELLNQSVIDCLDSDAIVQSMASAMKTLARPNAAFEIADVVLQSARSNHK